MTRDELAERRLAKADQRVVDDCMRSIAAIRVVAETGSAVARSIARHPSNPAPYDQGVDG
jgi:hypothetical protein